MGYESNQEAMLRARRQARAEFNRLKQLEREQNPHIPREHKRGIGLFRIFLVLILLTVMGVGGVAFWGYKQLDVITATVIPAREEPYRIRPGSTLSSVVRDLTGNAYHRYLLSAWVRLHNHEYPVIQKGDYLIDGVKTLPEILTDMAQGNVVKVKLPGMPLIEGMTITMVMRRLAANKDIAKKPELTEILATPDLFMEALLIRNNNDTSLLQAIGGSHPTLEGLLMPAIYEYEPGKTTDLELIAKALIKMANFMRERYIERNQAIDQVVSTPYQVLILASLVERESSLKSERALIAGVFMNRLRKGMRLQTDPAVMYGVSPDFKGPLRLSQLRRDTPYNTYTRRGLPPTPIAMPSPESIEAVLNPAQTDALYFVARGPDPKEGHIFSATLQEHNAAVKQYRKAVSDYKKEHAEDEGK